MTRRRVKAVCVRDHRLHKRHRQFLSEPQTYARAHRRGSRGLRRVQWWQFVAFTVDCEQDEELHLNISGKTLSASTVKTPIIAISNYVFNGLRQDAVSISDGAISEAFVSVFTDKE